MATALLDAALSLLVWLAALAALFGPVLLLLRYLFTHRHAKSPKQDAR